MGSRENSGYTYVGFSKLIATRAFKRILYVNLYMVRNNYLQTSVAVANDFKFSYQ